MIRTTTLSCYVDMFTLVFSLLDDNLPFFKYLLTVNPHTRKTVMGKIAHHHASRGIPA